MLPVMLSLIEKFPDHQFVVAGAPSQPRAFYEAIVGNARVEIWMNRTYELLAQASAAAVTSGTATLETALFGVPEVVCYKGSPISFAIGKRLVKVPFISLVNLILGREAVTELIQHDFTEARLCAEVEALLTSERQAKLAQDYDALRQKLGESGASARAAEVLLALVTQKTDRP